MASLWRRCLCESSLWQHRILPAQESNPALPAPDSADLATRMVLPGYSSKLFFNLELPKVIGVYLNKINCDFLIVNSKSDFENQNEKLNMVQLLDDNAHVDGNNNTR